MLVPFHLNPPPPYLGEEDIAPISGIEYHNKKPPFQGFLGRLRPKISLFPEKNGNTHAISLCIWVRGGGGGFLWDLHSVNELYRAWMTRVFPFPIKSWLSYFLSQVKLIIYQVTIFNAGSINIIMWNSSFILSQVSTVLSTHYIAVDSKSTHLGVIIRNHSVLNPFQNYREFHSTQGVVCTQG